MSGNDDVNFTFVKAGNASYTVLATDYVVSFDPTGGINVTLPAASAALAGRTYVLVQAVSNAGQATVKTAGGTINGVAAGTGIALTAAKIGLVHAVCDGTNWFAGGGTLVLS